jgi:parallel beta-helix repeat protein
MLKKLFYLFCLMALAPPITSAATYYVSSSSGDDANDGTSEASAWQTIDKVNSVKFAEGSTILFKRDELFRGAISSKGYVKELSFGAYGSGDKPIIAGSVQITGWTKTANPALGSKVYEADVSALPLTDNGIHHLFVNGELMTIARYPNVDSPADKNWLKVGAGAGTDAFTDPALAAYGKPNGYWTGATLRIRTYSWYYKVFEITGYSASNGKITAEGLGNQLPEWGYFLDGKLEELDHPGEWYYDATAQKVYFYPKNGTNPNNLLVEGSTYKTGINVFWHEDNTTIEDFTFRHFTSAGANINSSGDVILRNCHFEYNHTGVTVWKAANVLVSGNTFEHQLNSAIGLNSPSTFDVQNSVVEKNQITNTGMFPLYCRRYSGVCYGIGISVFGKAYTVRQNTLEYTGWIGIYLKDGGHHIIENNVVRKALSLLNDGGAISIGSDGNIIRGNFLSESIGNVDESNGCGSTNSNPCMHHPTYGMGIGADNNFKDNVIEGNTVANNPDMGIRLNAFTNTIVRNNVVYNNEPQIVVQDKKGPSHDNVIEGNIIYSLAPDQIGLSLTKTTNHGTFDNNVYCNPYNEVAVKRDGKRYSLAHWQNQFPSYDQNSKWCGLSIEEYSVSDVGTNLISNSNFDSDVSNWKGNIFYDDTKAEMDGGSLKAVYQGTGNLNVMPNTFDLVENQWSRLHFSIIGNGFGNSQLRTNDTTPDDYKILKERYFAYEQNRKDYEMFFQSPKTTSYGKHLFITKNYDADNYWLDNVTFEPVDATLNDGTQKSVLFTNPTANAKTISLDGKTYLDLDGNTVTGSITLAAFTSQILILSGEAPPTQFTLTINKNGDGSGTVTAPVGLDNGIDCGTDCTESYLKDTVVNLTATPDTGSTFAGWSGANCSDSITITANMTCTATFTAQTATTTYYVSSVSGNDTNDGRSPATAWQSLNKVNSMRFEANTTILFKRGEVFRGGMMMKGFPNGIRFDAYGSGDNPVIAGSVQISNWTKTTHPALGSKVYEADVSALPLTDKGIEHLFVNGELMTIARYPNVNSPADKNWLKVGASAGTDAFTDPALAAYGKPDGYWTDATLRLRTLSWYKMFKVTGYSASNGKITATGIKTQLPEWGYFLDGKLAELDHPGEWYYDATAKKVYLYPPAGINPNGSLIEGATNKVGIRLHRQNQITISNLNFRHYTSIGVYLTRCNNIVIENNNFEYNIIGMRTSQSEDVQIANNHFDHHLKGAIELLAPQTFDVKNSVVENNTISNTALFPGYGNRYDRLYQGIGIVVSGKGYTLRQNTVENTSHTGITLSGGGHHLLENNVVNHSLLLLNYGGALRIGSEGNTIRGNMLLNSVGNVDESNGCSSTKNTPCSKHSSYGRGIEASYGYPNNVIESNTVANNSYQGIRLKDFTNATVRDNVVFNNKDQLVLDGGENTIKGNILYSLTSEQLGMNLVKETNHGTIDNNYYCNPYNEVVIRREHDRYSLAHWQNDFSSYDQHSINCGLHFEEYSVSNVGANLIINSTFDTDVSNWRRGGATTISHDASQAEMDGGSLKAVRQDTKNGYLYPNSFELVENQSYRLKFSAIGNGFGNFQLTISDSTKGAYKKLSEKYFAYEQNRKDYDFIFKSPVTTSVGKHRIMTKPSDANTYWLDNVTFEPVDAVLNDATQYSVLFINTTANPKTISLEGKTYLDLDGNTVTGSITLAPFTSQILVSLPPTVRAKRTTRNSNFDDISLNYMYDSEADGIPAYLQVQDDQSLRFVTDNGVEVITVVQAPDELQTALAELGLPNFTVQANGNLKIYISEDSWYSARADSVAAADTPSGLYLTDSFVINGVKVLSLVFTDHNGSQREQMLYPALDQPETLFATDQNVVIRLDGLVNFTLDGQSYHGIVDYLVTKSTFATTDKVQVLSLPDVNGDEIKDFALLYPTGELQTLFTVPTDN